MKSSLSAVAILAVLSIALGAPIAASANLLTNGGFEDEPNWGASNGTGCGSSGDTGCSALSGSQLPGWTIESGHLVTVHVAGVYPTISGTYSVNTDGEGFGGVNSDFFQDFASATGQPYSLQYDWFGWESTSTADLDVTVIDLVTTATLYHGNFTWSAGLKHVTAAFTGTGNPLRLRIQEIPASDGNDDGFIVDNFDVELAQGGGVAESVPSLSRPLMSLLAVLALGSGLVLLRARRG
jgi:hypothetical protein